MMYAIAMDARSEKSVSALDGWLERHFPDRARVLPQLWIVEGSLAAEQIRTGTAPLLAAEDRFVIVKTAREALGGGLPGESAAWLKEHFPDSLTERIP
ncbi:MAG TPA: hypothetical protein VKV32_01170 [Stellaceae bacterium]|nr:hypothetical protein [Stellaceae bacterium]